jgi:branched-subunit amino acid ABC-type transport system permease component
LDPFLSLVFILPLVLVVGFLVQKYLLNRAMAVSADAPVIICLGFSLMLANMFQMIWSPLSRGLTTSYSLTSYNIGLPSKIYFSFCGDSRDAGIAWFLRELIWAKRLLPLLRIEQQLR